LAAALRENQLLRQKVDLLVRRVFGSSSENCNCCSCPKLHRWQNLCQLHPARRHARLAPDHPRRRACPTTCR
jgi:hypothetical protein